MENREVDLVTQLGLHLKKANTAYEELLNLHSPEVFTRYTLENHFELQSNPGYGGSWTLAGYLDWDPAINEFFRFDWTATRGGQSYSARWQKGDQQENSGVQLTTAQFGEPGLTLYRPDQNDMLSDIRLHQGGNIIRYAVYRDMRVQYECYVDDPDYRVALWNRTTGYTHPGFLIGRE